MKCKIKSEGNIKVFDVDGKIIYPYAYMSYVPLKEDIDDFKKHGAKLFMFGVYAGDEGINMVSGLRPLCDNFFKGYGDYDFTVVDNYMNLIAPTGEEDVYVIPRVCLEPPKWWQKLYPEELALNYRGELNRQCFVSEKWREDMSVALKALIDHIENSKWKNIVIGYHIAAGGTEEWGYHGRYLRDYQDYSLVNTKAYQKWLKDKYQTIGALNAVWDIAVQDFDDVKIPQPVERRYAKKGFLRNPETEMRVLDYIDFYNEAVADTIDYFCKVVKDYTNGERVTGVFYGYCMMFSENTKGTHALHKVLESPYVDFLSTTNGGHAPGDAWHFASAVNSALLHNKMWISEGDIRTCICTPMEKYLPHAMPINSDYYCSKVWKGPATMELTESVLTRALSRILTSYCGIWWFGMFGNWFSDERIMKVIEKTGDLLASQKKEYAQTDVAVIIDERGYKYFGNDPLEVRLGIWKNQSTLSHAGFTYHNYLLSDIKRDDFPADKYKMYIFVCCVDPEEGDKKAIREKLQCKNKTLVWLHASSAYDEELCGFRMSNNEDVKVESVLFEREYYGDFSKTKPDEWCAEASNPILKLEDTDGYVLASFAKSHEPAVIWKTKENYNTVLCRTMAPSSSMYRQLAILAGVHLYNRDGDCIFAGGEYVAIHSKEEGCRKIILPERGFEATNVMTGEKVVVDDLYIPFRMQKHETILLHLEKKEV